MASKKKALRCRVVRQNDAAAAGRPHTEQRDGIVECLLSLLATSRAGWQCCNVAGRACLEWSLELRVTRRSRLFVLHAIGTEGSRKWLSLSALPAWELAVPFGPPRQDDGLRAGSTIGQFCKMIT